MHELKQTLAFSYSNLKLQMFSRDVASDWNYMFSRNSSMMVIFYRQNSVYTLAKTDIRLRCTPFSCMQ